MPNNTETLLTLISLTGIGSAIMGLLFWLALWFPINLAQGTASVSDILTILQYHGLFAIIGITATIYLQHAHDYYPMGLFTTSN